MRGQLPYRDFNSGCPPAQFYTIAGVFSEICRIDLEAEDGMVYRAETLNAAAIREEQEYDGVRVTFEGRLHQARIPHSGSRNSRTSGAA